MIALFVLALSATIAGIAGPIRYPILSFLSAFFYLPALLWALERIKLNILGRKSLVFLTCFAMTLIQFRWGLTHPYWYILIPWFLFSFIYAVHWTLLVCIINRTDKLCTAKALLIPSSCWVLFEYSRHFLFSGFSFYPWGLYLTSSLSIAQWTSLAGIYLLSFFSIGSQIVIWRTIKGTTSIKALFVLTTFWLTLFGAGFIFQKQTITAAQKAPTLTAALIQPHFPLHVDLGPKHQRFNPRDVLRYWDEIYSIASIIDQPIDLIALPEIVVPFDAQAPIAKLPESQQLLNKYELINQPDTYPPHAYDYILASGAHERYSSHLYFAQALANHYDCDVIFGVQHEIDETKAYSAALITRSQERAQVEPFYAKRVLVPMGEYIPFSFLSSLAANYGVMDSFTPGHQATLLKGKKTDYGISICYEEIFGTYVRQSSKNGAKVLVNISNGGWFPGHLLPLVHYEHARVRAIENRLSLVRSCNTGVTAGIDPTGQAIAKLDLDDYQRPLIVNVPIYESTTLYELTGDSLIILISLALICVCLIRKDSAL